MNPGRNDPCPCGSGKKYKKCCLERLGSSQAGESSRPVEPRFSSRIGNYYTVGAVAEALRPNGAVKVHPYALLKLRDDPRLLSAATPEIRAGLAQSSRASSLAAMATDEIEIKLGLMGVAYDRSEFMERTKKHTSAWRLGEEWGAGLVGLRRDEVNFLALAACELWRRICPNPASVEMLDDWLCEGYALVAKGNYADGLAAWWRFWEALRLLITPEMRNLNEAGEKIFHQMSECLPNWATDFRIESLNGAMKDPQCGELGIRFIREILNAFPEEDQVLQYSGDLGTLLFQLERDSEAEQHCRALIQSHPDQAVGYVTLSDGLLRRSRKSFQDAEVRRAIGVLEEALASPVINSKDYDVSARLKEARGMLQ